MEIFIATSIKSFDLNPTHPGPLPRASFHTSATQQIERSKTKRREGGACSATDEVGDELQESASGDQDELAGGKRYVARAESSCEFLRARGQGATSAEKRFVKQPQRLDAGFEFAFS